MPIEVERRRLGASLWLLLLLIRWTPDDSRILVLDWSGGWTIRAEKEIFAPSREEVVDAFLLLSPEGG